MYGSARRASEFRYQYMAAQDQNPKIYRPAARQRGLDRFADHHPLTAA
jgi:hypothetical protein